MQITILNPRVIVHAPKFRVDGITKFLENTTFNFDYVRAARRHGRVAQRARACRREDERARGLGPCAGVR